jgi:hypothetical protein
MVTIHRKRREHVLYTRGVFLELRNDARAPPTVAVSVGVVFTPYVVEAVGHFMAANAAHAS